MSTGYSGGASNQCNFLLLGGERGRTPLSESRVYFTLSTWLKRDLRNINCSV